MKVTTKKRNINNENLFKEIDTFMQEVFEIPEIDWLKKDHREQCLWLVEDYLDEVAETTGKIIQHEVICDKRNNPHSVQQTKNVMLSIKYKQKNCLNTSRIDYTFSDDSN